MAWRDVMVPMVRTLIGDVVDPLRYTDDRVESAIITSGLIVSGEFETSYDYTFDFVSSEIIPDPTDPQVLDNETIALISLKAACMLSVNDYQKAVGAGIRVRDGDSEVDTTGRFKGYSDIIKVGPCASYDRLLESLIQKNSMLAGGAISSPYSYDGSTWGNRGFYGSWNLRGFFDSWLLW